MEAHPGMHHKQQGRPTSTSRSSSSSRAARISALWRLVSMKPMDELSIILTLFCLAGRMDARRDWELVSVPGLVPGVVDLGRSAGVSGVCMMHR